MKLSILDQSPIIAGHSAAACREKRLAIAEQFSADEFMVLTITGDYATRLDSYERLAKAFKLG